MVVDALLLALGDGPLDEGIVMRRRYGEVSHSVRRAAFLALQCLISIDIS